MNPEQTTSLEPMTVRERILVHLAKYPEKDKYLAKHENTQDGVAEGVGIHRAHAAVELKKMYYGGEVTIRLGRINGGQVRRKVYFKNGYKRTVSKGAQRQIQEALCLMDRAARIMRGMRDGI